MNPLLRFTFVLFILLGLSSIQAAEPERVFRAGVGIADITPPLGEMVVGGFAPFPAKNVHDKLHARCLVLDNGQTSVAFLICDNLGIRRDVFDEARKQIGKVTKLPPENILMAATHTHSGTRSHTEKYRPIIIAGMVKAARSAFENLEPAQIGWGGIDEPSELFNRRWHVSEPDLAKNPFGGIDKVRMNPPRGNPALVKPAGPIDPEISFISVQTRDGKPLGLLANYSLHYVGGVNKGDLSADYFGIFSSRIAELLHATKGQPAFVGMLTNGTSGDVNNINFRKNSRDKRYERYEKMTEVAEKVARRVYEANEKIKFQQWVKLDCTMTNLTLKSRKPDDKMQAYFAKLRSQPKDAEKHHRYELVYADRVQRLLDGPDEIEVPLQVLRIGNLAVCAIPFEVFTEIGLEIKARSPFGDTFTIELANDSRGYLPTPAQHKLGGYETWMGTSRVQLDGSTKIVKSILGMMDQLISEKDQ